MQTSLITPNLHREVSEILKVSGVAAYTGVHANTVWS